MKKIHVYANAGALLAAISLASVSPLWGQDKPAARWSVVTITTVKPEMRNEYEAWQKQLTAAYKKAEVPSRAVLQTVMGDLFEYISVYPIAKFAELDGPSPVERALGKDPAANLMRKGMSYVTSAHRMANLAMDDMSIRTEGPPAPYTMVTSMRLAAGKSPEFDAWMKNDYLPAMKKVELKNFWVSRTVFGGDPNERITVRPMHELGEIDAGPLTTKALGAEGARNLMSKTAGVVESVQYRIVRYRADLSYDMKSAAGQKSAAVQ